MGLQNTRQTSRTGYGLLLGLAMLFTCLSLMAQPPAGIRTDSQGRPMGAGSQMKGGDSLQQRDNTTDSITIYFRMFDSSRIKKIDSAVGDFYLRFPQPANHLYLGSLGSASRSLIFSPNLRPGFDPGFHGYDPFRFNIEQTRIFQTTRPYTELDYILGSKSEQTIKILHTQNISPTWNASFEYLFVSSPGNFKNNNSSHSNMRFTSGFATKNRRYSGNFIFINNRNNATQNGGIQSDTFLTSTNQAYHERFNIPTWLAGDGDYGTNFFATGVATGSKYKHQQFYFRHQYDLGQKDSSLNVEDSSVTRIFYPRLRVQHSFSFQNHSYQFFDQLTTTPDYNAIYQQRFGLTLVDVPLNITDTWKDLTNEGAIILFPEKSNQDQFLKLGTGYQFLSGGFGEVSENFTNFYLLGEYRNRTRNRKWDINAFGRLYLAGLNGGDYTGSLSLERNLGSKLGVLRLGFQNTNRTPSFVFDPRSSFFGIENTGLNQENWTRFSGELYLNKLKMKLLGNYYLVSNYTYWKDYYTVGQEATLLNVLHMGAEKVFKLSKYWNWYAELHVQQGGSNQINLPPVYTRNRIAYEGVFFKNLNLSTGVEFRYFLPFKADDWSPFNQQWVVQNKETISNRPDVSAFMHLRIRSFRLYARLENLNTIDFSQGFGFLNNNLSAPLYPTPGLFMHFGIYWSFVN